MRSGDPCPRGCGEDVMMVTPADHEWQLDPDEFEDGETADVWLCVRCGWFEEADDEDAIEEHMANLEWAMGVLNRRAESGIEQGDSR